MFDTPPTALSNINCDEAYPAQETLTASDDCGTATVTMSDDIPASPDYCAGFTVTYTWTAEDACGSTTVTSTSFNVLPDTADPVFDTTPGVLADINCQDAYPTQETLTASDSCGTVTVTMSDDIPSSPDYCAGFTVTYTWTAEDLCGNTTVTSTSFNVLPDTTDPVFDTTPGVLADINCQDAYPVQEVLTASDSCGTVTVTMSDDIPASPDYCAGFTVCLLYTSDAADE